MDLESPHKRQKQIADNVILRRKWNFKTQAYTWKNKKKQF